MSYLLVVESPSKAKTINKYLGNNYKVLASMGHIRALPKKNGSVEVDNNFNIKYELISKASKAVKDLVETASKSEKILLAPDPDREGEAIAWHVLEVLKQKKAINEKTKIERVVFNAITKDTVEAAIKNPRAIDMNLVNAQQARVALDYLVGFNLSPVLWKKLPGSKSAGRVQSVALRLICEREKEIEEFKKQEYWTIDIELLNRNKEKIVATLTHINDKKIDKFFIQNQQQAMEIKKHLDNKKYKVLKIEKKQIKKNPFPPFTTSTLQQEASKKLGFSAKTTMSIAQKLYEGKDTGNGAHGLITYMRTDGVYTAPEAINAARQFIKTKYGEKYLPEKPILYQNKVKNAQEAHEAIRPTNPKDTPESLKKYLTNEEYKLYDLIWKRLIASQMSSVIFDQVAINIETEEKYAILRAVGSIINFDGFYILYNVKKEEDEEKDLSDDEKILPIVEENEYLSLKNIKPEQHWTEPPARYSEASLVKKMEELGIGRPSTYATILSVIQERQYVKLEKKKFIPENRGIVVTEFLKKYFSKYVQYDYTAGLENDLDEISNGQQDWKKFLKDFWVPFNSEIENTLKISTNEILDNVMKEFTKHIFGFNDKGELDNTCPECKSGKLSIKTGKFGLFVGCNNYPTCKYIKNIDAIITNNMSEEDNSTETTEEFKNKLLGQIDKENIYIKKGPYGFYIQKGEDDKNTKPKRVAIQKNSNINTFSIEDAKFLLELPKTIGKHPIDNEDVKVNIGPYGPYISYNKQFYSVKNKEITSLTLNEAIEIIKNNEKKPKVVKDDKKKSIKKKATSKKIKK